MDSNRQQRELDKFVEVDSKTAVRTLGVDGLITESYDYVDVTYTDGDPTTIVYKTGGASGTVVATLTITYTDGCISTITKI